MGGHVKREAPLALEVMWGDSFTFTKVNPGPVVERVPDSALPPQQVISINEQPARTWGITLSFLAQFGALSFGIGDNAFADFEIVTGVGRAVAKQLVRLTLDPTTRGNTVAQTLFVPASAIIVGVRFELPAIAATPLPIQFKAAVVCAPQFPFTRGLEALVRG